MPSLTRPLVLQLLTMVVPSMKACAPSSFGQIRPGTGVSVAVLSASMSDVRQWLVPLGLSEYGDSFEENAVETAPLAS